MRILCLGNKKKFRNDIIEHTDNIIDLYNDGLYLNDSKKYTDGYLSGIQYVLNKISFYEEKELNKIMKGAKYDI